MSPFSSKLDTESSNLITQSRKALECFSLEDLVSQRHAVAVVNPWLSRWVILCKDGLGKIGLRVQTYQKGVFVSLVIAGSPAAMAGLRFGDQLLTLGKTTLAGMTTDAVHCRLRCSPVNNIVIAVRDRPLCRSLVLHKDKAGRLGIKVKKGAVAAIAVNSSAARNGLLTDHQVIEVNGACVVGLTDRDIGRQVEDGGDVVTITIMQSNMFREITRGMSSWLVRNKMNHSITN